MRYVVGSILIIKYRSWCTLTFLKCVKKGKLCQNATLIAAWLPPSHPWNELAPASGRDGLGPFIRKYSVRKYVCVGKLIGRGG